jgi:hypothetical protein
MKNDELGEKHSKHLRNEKYIQNFRWNTSREDQLGDLGVDETNLKEIGSDCGLDSSGSG